MANEDDAIMQQFFGGGGQGRMDPMALAMQILEMGRKGREFETTSGLSREEHQAMNKYRQDVLAQEGVKQASEIGLADIQKQALLDEIAGRKTEAGAKRKFEEAQLENERRKAEMGMLQEYFKTLPADKMDKAMEMMAGYSEPVKRMMLGGREEALKGRALAALPGLEAGYTKGDPKQIAAAIQGLPQEVLQRPEIDWQKLAQGWGGEQGANAAGTAQGAGLAGRLWNLPGAAQNVGKGIVGGLLNLVMGEENAPKIAPTAYTNPLRQAAGAPVGQSNFAEVFAPAINAVQPGEYAPGAGFARGRGVVPAPQTVGAVTPPGAGDILQRLFGPR